jgi:uncharacterized protein YbdZ (MbtH family)
MNQETTRDAIYKVVVNHEEQFSICPAHIENAPGWRDEGKTGTKDECLAYIGQVWTDMRPLSVRVRMEEDARASTVPTEEEDTQQDLVGYLCEGEHPVIVSVRPERDAAELKKAIERGYVHVRFTGTRGQTELGIRVSEDCRASILRQDASDGVLRLEGDLVLDFIPVRCVVAVNPDTLSGTGRLLRKR